MRRPGPRMKVKATSKNQEKSILNRAKMLRKDPSLIAPTCAGECRSCPFKKLIKSAEKIGHIEDEEYIKKFFKKGDQLLRAYAVMISIDIEGKIPYLATADTPSGKVAYVYREGADKKALISLMYHDDPRISLMGYVGTAKKHKLHLYATKKGVICTGRTGDPPKNFMEGVVKSLPYNFRRSGTSYVAPPGELTVQINDWKISVCRKCASSESNIPSAIQRFMYSPERDGGLEVSVNFELEGEMDSCDGEYHPSKREIRDYLVGEISDGEFTESAWNDFRNEAEDKGLYMAGTTCFGSDWKPMIEGLDIPEKARKTVEEVVAGRKRGIVVDDYTTNKVLMEIWEEAAEKVLTSVSGEAIARQVLKMEKQNPTDMIREAEALLKKRQVNRALPVYKNLPEIPAFADRAAREYRIGGKKGLEAFLYSYKKPGTKIKSLQMAFMMAVGEHEGKEWHYSKNEMDFAEFLSPLAERLLKAKGKDYHRSLEELLASAGVDANLDQYMVKTLNS